MTKTHRILLSAFAGLSISASGKAADFRFIPRVNVGYMDYSLRVPSLPVTSGFRFPGTKFGVEFKFLELGGILSWKNYYFSVGGLTSTDESDSLVEPAFRYEEKFTGDRKDASMVLGMRPTDHLSLYLGWKWGRSKADGTLRSELEFKEDGFFIGGNYAWNIADKGLLALNVAVARLDGDLTIDAPAFSAPGAGGGFLLDATSQTTGLSYGISWHGILTDQLTYSLAVDANLYKFDDIYDKVQGKISGQFDEHMYIFRAGLAYRF